MSHSLERMFRHMDGGEMMTFLIVILIIAFAVLGIYIMFLLSLQRLMEKISPDLRKMPSGQVWLLLIPYFNYIWLFIMTARIADSLAGEFRRRNIQVFEERPGYTLGMAWGFLGVVGFFVGLADVPQLSGLVGLASLICWIVYWVKMNRFKTQLEQSGPWQMFMQQEQAFRYSQQYHQSYNHPGQQTWQNPYQQAPPNPYQQTPLPYPPQHPYQQTPPPYPPQNNPYAPPANPNTPPPPNPFAPPTQNPWEPKNPVPPSTDSNTAPPNPFAPPTNPNEPKNPFTPPTDNNTTPPNPFAPPTNPNEPKNPYAPPTDPNKPADDSDSRWMPPKKDE